jgi:violaxanthin de-epoxidase
MEDLHVDVVYLWMQGRWYITAGLNPLFDTFDCQVHYFGVPEPGKLYGKINWRIPKGNKDFIERSTVQTFDQASLPFC